MAPRYSGTAPLDVCLLSMPFPPLNQPSMAVALLSAALRQSGVSTRALFPCLWFAEEVGLDSYVFVGDTKQEFLVGEWIFAGAAFPDFAPDDDAFIENVISAPVSQGLMRKSGFAADPAAALRHLRTHATEFIDRAARRVLELEPKIVGCTSTFMQHCASLAILRRIRDLAPDVVTMIGGANCEGAMGAANRRAFPWLDFVVSGEADLLVVDLCRAILEHGRDLPHDRLPFGVIGGDHPSLADASAAPRASVQAMDRTPVPDFDDYFEALSGSSLAPFISPGLAIETSRGCWWGKVHHCTFCGLNGGNMDFRSKSADRVLAELEQLSTRHAIRNFNVVDNILDLQYLHTVLPRLAAAGAPYRLFFETKANLRREQVETIAGAGVRRLQPGIETMHDEVLRLIDKGTTALQNVRLLKWARELGVFITWNFLWDVPGEDEDWYREMAEWLPLVSHLQPPGVDRIQFHRFSPYHFRASTFGLSLTPYPSYRSVYPVDDDTLSDLAYYFHDPTRRPVKEELTRRVHLKSVMRVLGVWNRAWGQGGFGEAAEPPLLVIRRDVQSAPEGDEIEIEDTRSCRSANRLIVRGLAARVIRFCHDTQTPAALEQAFSDVNSADLRVAISDLVTRRLLLFLGGRYLSLALREVQAIPDSLEDFPGGFTDVAAWQEAIVESRAS